MKFLHLILWDLNLNSLPYASLQGRGLVKKWSDTTTEQKTMSAS